MKSSSHSSPLIFHVALVVSGAAALVYQSAWGRMLQRVFGVSDLAVATVLGVFFFGLGLGSWLSARFAPKVRRPAWTYALLELAIGAYAVLSLFLMRALPTLYASFHPELSFQRAVLLRAGLALLVLLPPTTLLGATLPFVVAAASRGSRHWASEATGLYTSNTVGAVLGAALVGFWALPRLGLSGSIVLAALASVSAALLVLYAPARQAGEAPPPDEAAERHEHATEQGREPGRPHLALVLAAGSGIAALAGEVVWTRVLRIVIQGTTQAFSAMLVQFLIGIALGSALSRKLIRWSPARALACLQLALGFAIALSVGTANHLPRVIALLRGKPSMVPNETWVILLSSGILLLPLALLLGACLPLTWSIAGGGSEDAAKHAGRTLAANTFGGLLGSFCMGFYCIPLLGTQRCLDGLVLLHFFMAALAFAWGEPQSHRRRAFHLAFPLLLALALLQSRPKLSLPFLLHARQDVSNAVLRGPRRDAGRHVVFLREGRNTTVSIVKRGDSYRLFNDGRPESGIAAKPPGFGPELVTLATLPSLLSETRDRALVIGLGAGHTTRVLLAAPWKRVDVVELEEAVVEAARRLHRLAKQPFPLDDARAHLVIDDARSRLLLAPPESYDAIVSQPSHPWLAGSSALYTREFFSEAKRALRPGGVLSLWINLFRIDAFQVRRVVETLNRSFPHVQAFMVDKSSLILCAGKQPLRLDERARTRFQHQIHVEQFLHPRGIHNFASFVAHRELDDTAVERFGKGMRTLSDDRPDFEYALASIADTKSLSAQDLDAAWRSLPWMGRQDYRALPENERLQVLAARLDLVVPRPQAQQRLERSLPLLGLAPSDKAELDGAFAENLGQVDKALRLYDRANGAFAAYRADRLRYMEGRHKEALDVAQRRGQAPLSYEPLIRMAWSELSLPQLQRALDALSALPEAMRSPLETLALRYPDTGCDAIERYTIGREDPPELLYIAERCAFQDEASDRAQGLGQERTRRLMRIAIEAFRQGQECQEGKNLDAAIMLYRRALLFNPAHASAAAKLAKLYVQRGRRDEAYALLRRTHDASFGYSNLLQIVREAAAEIGLRLPGEADVESDLPPYPSTRREQSEG